ncbi:hypothetical protein [Microbacterium pumilum]|uniref:Uncharacterized protein n=1 Tax=Microbacterium pumilum TaxID=344165 RepID=A0ABN2T387_9MICO
MSLIATLPERSFYPLVTPLDPYFNVVWDVEPEPEFSITSRTPMVLLPAVALATLRYAVGAPCDMHIASAGMVSEASVRLSVLWLKGSTLSAWEIALMFQMLWFNGTGDRRDRRTPLKGLDLIRATDELECGGLQWHCDMPTKDDPYTFERTRLKDALSRFER